jgi:hypothetical protein
MPSDAPPAAEDGAQIHGNVSLSGGDFVGRDQIHYGLNVDELVEALRRAFPANDPRPNQLAKVLQQFERYHDTLHEWKELHNALDEILNSLGQFTALIERLNVEPTEINAEVLRSAWRPVAARVELLLEFGAHIQQIGTPYTITPTAVCGERWAVELASLRSQINQRLGIEGNRPPEKQLRQRLGFAPNWWPELYELIHSFSDAAYRHMHLADKQLRQTATELYLLSRQAFGRNVP